MSVELDLSPKIYQGHPMNRSRTQHQQPDHAPTITDDRVAYWLSPSSACWSSPSYRQLAPYIASLERTANARVSQASGLRRAGFLQQRSHR
jgi:hypothetical protein